MAKDLLVDISHDPDVECPCDHDSSWQLYSFNRRHNRFRHPSEFNPETDAELKAKLESGLAFWLSYYEHSLCLWTLAGSAKWNALPDTRWDGVARAGILIWEAPEADLGAKSKEDRAKDAEAFLESYTEWANGNCFAYSINDDEAGETLDSCGGYIGAADVISAIRGSLVSIKDVGKITVRGVLGPVKIEVPKTA